MKRGLLCILLALCLLLGGCAAKREAEETDFWQEDDNTAEETPPVTVDFTLLYLPEQTLDPVTCPDGTQQTLGGLLYEGLFVLDERFQPQNVLCEHYGSTEGETLYTFSLRSDATFSDGTPLTANDVLATYRRAAASERYGSRLRDVAEMYARDERTLVIRLNRPLGAFAARLDIPVVKAGTEDRAIPLGTGPYRFSEDRTALSARTDWRQNVTLPLAEIPLDTARSISAAESLFSSFQIGLLVSDLASGGSSFTQTEVSDIPTSSMIYLGCNKNRPPLDDPAFRRALSAAFDRTTLVNAYFAGHALPTCAPVSPAFYAPPDAAAYTASAYGDALSEWGGTASLTLLVNADSTFKVAAAEYLAQQATAGGVSVTVRALPWEQYLAALQSWNYDLYLGETQLCADWDCTPLLAAGGSLCYDGGASGTMLAAAEKFLQSPPTLRQYCKTFSEEMPFIPLAFASLSVLRQSGVTGEITPTASTPFYRFENWTFPLSGEGRE